MSKPERYVLERHTDHPTYCWRVRDLETNETFGYGLSETDAARIAREAEAA